jgi:hypothetical protein
LPLLLLLLMSEESGTWPPVSLTEVCRPCRGETVDGDDDDDRVTSVVVVGTCTGADRATDDDDDDVTGEMGERMGGCAVAVLRLILLRMAEGSGSGCVTVGFCTDSIAGVVATGGSNATGTLVVADDGCGFVSVRVTVVVTGVGGFGTVSSEQTTLLGARLTIVVSCVSVVDVATGTGEATSISV